MALFLLLMLEAYQRGWVAMPRRRTLSPEFFSDEDLATLPFEARLLYAGLWCYADKEGRLEDRPRYLKAMLFPYDRVDVEKLLSLLANPQLSGRSEKVFIRRYQVEGRQLIDIPEFCKHQHPHHTEANSRYPAFNGYLPVKERIEGGMNTTNDQRPMTNDQKGKVKLTYGEFHNVRLTPHELDKLESGFGKEQALAMIENLSRYIASRGDKYKSHYATMLGWAAKDAKGATNGHTPHTRPRHDQATPGKYAHLGTVIDPGGED